MTGRVRMPSPNRPSKNHRRAGRCVVHDDLAWLYDDGGVQCMNRLVVEASSEECVFRPMPQQWRGEGQML